MNETSEMEGKTEISNSEQDSQSVQDFNQEKPIKDGSKKRLALQAGIVLLGCVIGALVLVSFLQKDETTRGSEVTVTQQAEKNNKNAESNIPNELLQKSFFYNGVSVGYLEKKAKESSSSFFFPKAYAEFAEYEPVIFYTNASYIFLLNTITKETKQITSSVGSKPMFSSMRQALAYSDGDCSVVVKNFSDDSEAIIATGSDPMLDDATGVSDSEKCYQPLAWSPDGSKLALGGLYSVNNSDLGLVGFMDLYIYDFTKQEMQIIDNPSEYTTIDGPVLWLTNDALLGEFQDRGAFASSKKTDVFRVDTSSGSLERTDYGSDLNLENTQILESGLISVNQDSQLVLSKDGIFGEHEKIGEIKIGTYLVKDEANLEIYNIVGDAGSENSFQLSIIDVEKEKERTLSNLDGYSNYVLGWGHGYDEIIYISVLSGKSEIRMYSLNDKSITTLVPDLSLGQ